MKLIRDLDTAPRDRLDADADDLSSATGVDGRRSRSVSAIRGQYYEPLWRVFGMSVGEVGLRARQAMFKQLERALWRGSIPTQQQRPAMAQGQLVADGDPTLFPASVHVRFFGGLSHPGTPRLLETIAPGTHQRLRKMAASLGRGHFRLLGYPDLFFGTPVDWHFDPVSGRHAPALHWSRIDALDTRTVGDAKVIWELNRHQWMVTLGQAYRCHANEYYADVFARCFMQWMQSNPPGFGINWTSSLEVAIRIQSWALALNLFRDSPALSADLQQTIIDAIAVHASHVERYLSVYFSPNTHLTGEALGLFYAGLLLPRSRRSRRWRTLGQRILVEQIERQVYTDGTYFEQSICYQRYTVEIYLQFLILAEQNGIAVAAIVGARVQAMLDFLLAMQLPDGSMPQIGDTDGGSLLPFATREPTDCRGVFALAAVVFHRPDYGRAGQGASPEVLWLLGPDGCTELATLCGQASTPATSRVFAEGGYEVMRCPPEGRAAQLIFDTGPLGCGLSSGHGHADLLSVQCAAFGEACLVDPGTYTYANARWRNHFRGSAAHNTVVVDGLSQAEPTASFKWRQQPRAYLRRWLSTPDVDFADAEHHAYQRLPDGVTHRRRVLLRKPDYWVIVDDLLGSAVHQIELCFQFAPMPVAIGDDGWVRARRSNWQGECRLRTFATTPLAVSIVSGALQPMRGWVAPHYGRRIPAPQLTYIANDCLPLRFITLLLPVADGQASPQVVVSPDLGELEVRFADLRDRIRIDADDMLVEHLA